MLQSLDPGYTPVLVVSPEALISAVSRESDRDVLAHRSTDCIDSEERRIREGLAHVLEQAGDVIPRTAVAVHLERLVAGADRSRDARRGPGLVEVGVGETNVER